jgi:hypothetical protein
MFSIVFIVVSFVVVILYTNIRKKFEYVTYLIEKS